ncbi:MAG TPA: ABC transporter permease [Thermoleophilia bacterium]|nr:ABC transporter permease [Thermoleophilia bacterium]
MGKYVVRRLLWVVVVLFFVSIITFLLAYAVPGDPAKSIAGVHATPEVLERIRTELGLDKPVYEQYRIYLTNLLQGDMGFSYETQRPVAQSILERFPATVMVALYGIFFELLIGIPVGMVSALKQYSLRDRVFTVLSLLGIAAPGFWLGMLFLYVLAYQFPIFPLGGYEGWAAPLYGVLPGLTLGVGGAAWYSRMLRSSMLDILGADYVRAARAKGLPERTVVWRHIMRNAWGPIITLLGMDVGWFLGGVLVIEVVFGIPGIGWQAWNAIQTQDLPMIMGTVLFAAVLVTLSNLVVDIAYTWLDPRVKYS